MKDNNRCDKFSCINKYISQAIGFVAGAGFSWRDVFLQRRGGISPSIIEGGPASGGAFATALVVRKTELISNRKFDKYL